jgi:DNA-binding beta-propeller fold protein YncE
MKKRRTHLLIFCIAVAVALCFSTGVSAEVEWNTLKDIDLQETPLDITVSRDGLTAFILCEKSIKLYSIREGKVTDTLPITGRFSQIALSPDGETLLLTDTEKKQLSVIRKRGLWFQNDFQGRPTFSFTRFNKIEPLISRW